MALRQISQRLSSRVCQALAQDLAAPSALLGQAQQCTRMVCASTPSEWVIDRADFPWQKLSCRQFQTGSVLLKDIDVEIQAMGESITEGTIAEVLKKEGDSVAEDETIAQIETDKVTIDVKAPSAGTIKELKVSPDDTVKVGQLVAVISEGDTSAGAETSSSSSEAEPKADSKEEDKSSKDSGKKQEDSRKGSSKDQQSTGTDQEQHGHEEGGRAHKPLIKFPSRMTPDGRRISELPAAEQQQSTSHHGQGERQSSPVSTKPSAQPAKSMPWYIGKEQGTKLSQSSVLSQYEMEQIELGGADP